MSDATDSGIGAAVPLPVALALPIKSSISPSTSVAIATPGLPGHECCLNCLQSTAEDQDSVTQFQLGDSILQIDEVLCFIFNLSLSAVVPKETLRNLTLCSTCASIIKQTYECHQELLGLTHMDSWLHFVLEQQQIKAKSLAISNMSPKEELSIPPEQSSSSSPRSHNIVNMLPVQVIPSTKRNGTLVAPIKNKKIKQALISTDPGTESILIFETNESTHSSSSLSSSNPLKRRMLVPTEFYDLSRAHSCTTCGESFLQKSSLDFHIHWIHNGKTKYLCNLCLQPLGSENILEQHMKSQHPEIINPIEHIKRVEVSPEKSSGRAKRSNRKSSTPQKIESPLLPVPLSAASAQGPEIPIPKTREFVCSSCSQIFPTVTLRNGHERTCKLPRIPEPDEDQHHPIDYGKKTRITVISSAPPASARTIKNEDVEELQCPYSPNCIVLVSNAPTTSFTTKRKLLLKHIKTVHPEQKVRLEVLDDFILRSELSRRQAEISAGGSSIPAPPPAKRTNHRTTSATAAPSPATIGIPSRVIIRSTSSATNTTGAVTALPIPTFSGPCSCGTELLRVSRSKVEEHFKFVHGLPVRFLCPFCSICLGTVGKNSFRKHLISHYTEEGRSSEEDRLLQTECGLVLRRDNLEN